ncbi:MAG: hypothetical protein U0794_21650 [Isosphaeraceae bacterium]
MAPIEGNTALSMGNAPAGEVVEIPLLLPASWAASLIEMSTRHNQSVGQMLRTMIDRAICDDRRRRG